MRGHDAKLLVCENTSVYRYWASNMAPADLLQPFRVDIGNMKVLSLAEVFKYWCSFLRKSEVTVGTDVNDLSPSYVTHFRIMVYQNGKNDF